MWTDGTQRSGAAAQATLHSFFQANRQSLKKVPQPEPQTTTKATQRPKMDELDRPHISKKPRLSRSEPIWYIDLTGDDDLKSSQFDRPSPSVKYVPSASLDPDDEPEQSLPGTPSSWSPQRSSALPNLDSDQPNESSGEDSDDAAEAAPQTTYQLDPELCPEQADLVDLIASGRNVFYTGSAGCGKSTVLKAFTRLLRDMGKKVHILAPTGRAALQVNGTTTWTYAGWTPDSHKRPLKELVAAAHGKNVWKRFDGTDVLVIDEISMVENHHFERLNAVMKEARFNPNLDVQPAFGGVQVIVTGDFCQLPPVEPFRYCIECGTELKKSHHRGSIVHTCHRHGSFPDEDKWAFRSEAWRECDFSHVHLWTIHRQRDEAFIRILQKCRLGDQLLPQEVDLLLNHESNVQNATQLFPLRKGANDVNMAAFNRLKTENHAYWCLDHFDLRNPKHPNKDRRADVGPASQRPLQALDAHRYEERVQIKRGMLVVLLINLDLESGLCNGSQGIVCGFQPYDPAHMPRAGKRPNDPPELRLRGDYADKKEKQIRLFIQGEGAAKKFWPVVRFLNGEKRTIYADCSITECGDEKPYSLLYRTQIPLAPAWAMTIHKSQSLTLSRVIVNLENAFQEGQVYVALSRATSLAGLKITGNADKLRGRLEGNKQVQEFLREKFGDRAAPQSSRQQISTYFQRSSQP